MKRFKETKDIGMIDERVMRIVRKIKRYLKEKYGEKIKDVILYGSYARGDVGEDSDIDILVVVSDDANIEKINEDLDYLSGEYYVREIELVNPFAVKESEYLYGQSDFLINVKKEGIVV